jgi:hypothetical protein
MTLDPDRCVLCGQPAVAGGLCHHDAEQALNAAHALVAALDTPDDLTDPNTIAAWVPAIQDRMAAVAGYTRHREGVAA